MHYILFVDSENLPSSIVPSIQQVFSRRGDTYEALVYGCSASMGNPWKQAIADANWKFVNVRRTFGDGQALDMAMILDMVDTFHMQRQHGIAVASGDSDFLPALLRIQGHGGSVLVLTDPQETSKKVREALPDAIEPIHKPHNHAAAVLSYESEIQPATASMMKHKRQVITISLVKEQAIRRICIAAFNEYVTTQGTTEMPVSKLITAFQKEDHWFKTKTLGFKNMRELAMSVGLFSICKHVAPQGDMTNEWFLRRRDNHNAPHYDDNAPVDDVAFASNTR